MSAKWERIQRDHLPGYDPYATAGDDFGFDAETAELMVGCFGDLELIEG